MDSTCACGCGLTTSGKFRAGHYWRTAEGRAKARERRLGKKWSASIKAKISENRKGKYTGPRSDEIKTKIAESLKGNQNCLGRKLSDETKEKMSSSAKAQLAAGSRSLPSRKGSHLTEEHKQKLAESRRGIAPWNKGKPTSPETREKQSKAKRGYKWSPEAIEARKRGQARASAKMSASQKRRWSSLSSEQRSEAIKNWHRLSVRPTKPELAVKKLIKLLGLPFEYNGHADGVRIDGLQPDFIRTDGAKDVVLVHGCYWHKCYLCYPEKFDSMEAEGLLTDETERYRTEGYSPLVIWEHDLKVAENVVERLTSVASMDAFVC